MPKNIIISRTDSIGDVVLTLPMLGAIKRSMPDTRIIFLGNEYVRPVVETSIHVDEFLAWDSIKNKSPNEQIDLFKSIKADIIIHVFPVKAIAIVAKKAGIPLRIGTSHRIYHWTTCNRKLNMGRKNSALHEAQLNLMLLQTLEIRFAYNIQEIHTLYGITKIPGPSVRIKKLIDPNRFNLILHPKSKGSAREWGLDNFSALINILPPRKVKIFITGTSEEGLIMKDFLISNAENIVDLTGELSLIELISFIAVADGLVAASTGPLHIAAALGKKAVGLYPPIKPMHPGRWGPVGTNAKHLVKKIECNDCRRNRDCHCIREIELSKVIQALGL